MSRASLPPDGYRRPDNLRIENDVIVVLFRASDSGRTQKFKFDYPALSQELTRVFADGFAHATGVGGSRRTLSSATSLHGNLRFYARFLASLPNPPRTLQDLRPAHIEELRLAGNLTAKVVIHAMRLVMKWHPQAPADYVAAVKKPFSSKPEGSVEAYSAAEFRAVRRSMRRVVRDALSRVRRIEQELEAACDDRRFTGSVREIVLRELALSGDVPRRPNGASRYRSGIGIAKELFPSLTEVSAAAVLMQCMTGQNHGTVLSLTTQHHRADDQQNEQALVQARTSKPRRDRYRSEQSSTYSSEEVGAIEGDLGAASDSGLNFETRDDFNSAAGVYSIALELCARSRAVAKSLRLFCGYAPHSRPKEHNGSWCRELLPRMHIPGQLRWAFDSTIVQGVDTPRVRRAFLDEHRRPVDQTVTTMNDDYLIRDAAVRRESQVIVADALADEESRLRTASMTVVLGVEQVEAIRRDSGACAADLGIASSTLSAAIDGELDTVATGCVSNLDSPYSRKGVPCTASFLLCLGCPNALAEPRHVPVLGALSSQLELRREVMTAESWDSAFGLAYAQSKDLLRRLREAGAPEPPTQTAPQVSALVEMLIDGKLDVR